DRYHEVLELGQKSARFEREEVRPLPGRELGPQRRQVVVVGSQRTLDRNPRVLFVEARHDLVEGAFLRGPRPVGDGRFVGVATRALGRWPAQRTASQHHRDRSTERNGQDSSLHVLLVSLSTAL